MICSRVSALLCSILLLFFSFQTVSATTLELNNANFAADDSKVIVAGKLDDLGASYDVTITDALTGGVLASLSDVKMNFNAHIVFDGTNAIDEDGTIHVSGPPIPCTVTVTSGEVSATADVKHAPAGCSNRFTLTGQIVDNPLPNATVTVTVGGQTFTTVADENGFYSLDIAAATVGDLVTIEADAANPSVPGQTVDFISLAGTFSKLLSDPVENVTNVTTAEFSLLVQANNGEEITSVEELHAAETQIDATALLELAAVIKLIVDDPTFSLPEGQTSIVDFIADQTAVDQFIADAEVDDPDIINDTITEIVTDSGLVEGFSVAEIPNRFYSIASSRPGFVSLGGEALDFNSTDFTGRLVSSSFAVGTSGVPFSPDFNWSVDNGVLVLEILNAPAATFFTFVELLPFDIDPAIINHINLCAAQDQVGQSDTLIERTYTRIVDGALVDITSRTDKIVTTFDPIATTGEPGCEDPIQLPDQFPVYTQQETLRDSNDVVPIPFTDSDPAVVDVIGTWGSVYFFDPGETVFGFPGRGLRGEMLTFNADHTGTAQFAGESFTWQISGDDLVVTYADGWTQTSTILDRNGFNQSGKQFGVFHVLTNGVEAFANYTHAIKRDPSFNFSEAELERQSPLVFWNSILGAWTLDSVDAEGNLLDFFGWMLDAAPDGFRVLLAIFDVDGDGTDDSVWLQAPGLWQVQPDGQFRMDYTRERSRFWIPIAEEPITEDPASGDPIDPAVRKFYVMEYETQPAGLRIVPRINIMQEVDIPEVPAL